MCAWSSKCMYLLCCVDEVSRAHCFLHSVPVLPAALHLQVVPLHDGRQLLAYVLRATELARLDEVLEAKPARDRRKDSRRRQHEHQCQQRGRVACEMQRAVCSTDWFENFAVAQAWYTVSSVRWSPSGAKNLARFWSACACLSFGPACTYKHIQTGNMER